MDVFQNIGTQKQTLVCELFEVPPTSDCFEGSFRLSRGFLWAGCMLENCHRVFQAPRPRGFFGRVNLRWPGQPRRLSCTSCWARLWTALQRMDLCQGHSQHQVWGRRPLENLRSSSLKVTNSPAPTALRVESEPPDSSPSVFSARSSFQGPYSP